MLYVRYVDLDFVCVVWGMMMYVGLVCIVNMFI